MKKQQRVFFQKAVSIVTGLFLVFQSLTPGFFVSSRISAQDTAVVETPTPTVVPAPEQPKDNEVTPTVAPEVVSPTPSVEHSPMPTPTAEPSIIETPEPNQEISPTIEPQKEDPVANPSDPPKEAGPPENSDTPEEQTTPTPEATPTVTPEPTPEVIEQTCEQPETTRTTSDYDWSINEFAGTAETRNPVELGVTYVFPKNTNVSVTFTCLPKDTSKRTALKIQEVAISELKLPDGINSTTSYAYDITTGMKDGTFKYTVTLPTIENENSGISYIEKNVSEIKNTSISNEEVKQITEHINQNGDKVTASEIDHFTIYIVTTTGNKPTLSTALVNGQSQVTVKPNTQITVTMKVTTGGEGSDDDWRSSQYKIGTGSWICTEDTGNHNGDNTYTNDFTFNAPTTIGTYDLTLKAYNSDNCSGGASSEYVMTDAITVLNTNTTLTPPTLTDNPSDTYAFTSVSGIWTDISGGSGHEGENTNEIHWGTPAGSSKSGLKFTNSGAQSFNEAETFYLGMLTHMNWGTMAGTAANGATLQITLDFNRPDIANQTFTYDFDIEETTNQPRVSDCHSGYQISSTPCDDKVTFPTSYGSTSFTIGDKLYTLKIDGFVNAYPEGSPVSQFITEEEKNNSAFLVGSLSSVLVAAPQISLVQKAVNGDDADTAPGQNLYIGDTANFTYSVQNTGNVTMTNIVVHDNKGISVTCPKTTLLSGESMICTASSTVVSGQYTNTAHAHGTYNSTQYTSNDESANYFGITRPADKKVTLCHSTSSPTNPYNKIDVNINSTSKCLNADGHGLDPNDIIPSYTYGDCTYPGLNLATVISGSTGQQILDNGCEIPPTKGTLIVKKILTNDNGGTKTVTDFSFKINGDTAIPFEVDGQNEIPVNPGTTYSVTETPVTGYDITYANCSGITIAAGQTKTCEIRNNDISPKLTVTKVVTGSSEPISSFPLYVKNSTLTSPVNSGQQYGFNAGIWTIGETNKTGYTATITGDCATDGTITLNPGDVKACTITNKRDTGVVTFQKLVDDGSSVLGWLFTVKDSSGATVGTYHNGNTATLPTGAYTVTESGATNYAFQGATGICAKDLTSGIINMNVTTTGGTCTFTNVYVPYCGDGIKNQVSEQCDDGNMVNTDACTNDCKNAICGDGIKSDSEECDNGEANKFTCTPPYGGSCSFCHATTCTTTTLTGPYCGDGTIQRANGEQCDDSNTTNGDGCSATCQKEPGTITFIKDANPHDTQAFNFDYESNPYQIGDFSLTDDDNGDDSNKITFSSIPAGTYTWHEDTVSGWNLTNISCTESKTNNSTISIHHGRTKIVLDPGEDVTCTYTNTKKGTAIVEKQTVPDGSAQAFKFDPSWPGGNFHLSDGQQKSKSLSPGTYTVNEIVPTNWALTSVVCDDKNSTQSATTSGAVFNIEAGETVTCVFTNTRQDSVITGQKYEDVDMDQVKDTGESVLSGWTIFIDKNGNKQFDTGELSTVTDANGNYSLSGLLDASVSVCEVQKPDWDTAKKGLCKTVSTTPGQTTSGVDFGNWKTGYIIIAKNLVPDDAGGWFDMYLDATLYGTVNADWTSSAIKVPAGRHTVREVGAYGTVLSDYATHVTGDCDANGNVTVGQGQTKRCTIVNTKIPVYTGSSNCPKEKPVKKLASSYTISSTDKDGLVFAGLAAGNYLFEATGTYVSSSGGGWKSDAGFSSNNNWSSVDTNYGINGVAPNYGAHALLADLGSGVGIVKWGPYNTSHQYNFYTATPENPQFVIGDRWSDWYGTAWDNQKGMSDNSGALTLNVYTCESTGTITIDKATAPTEDEQKFDFTVAKDTTTVESFSLADADAPHTNAYEAGHYTVSEAANTAWEPGDISCQSTGGITNLETDINPTDPPARVSFDLAAGGNVTCTFHNTKYGSVTVTKFNDANGNGMFDREEAGIPEWDITLDDTKQTTNALGIASFSGLMPSTYYLDETVKDGWEQTVISCSNEQELTTTPQTSPSLLRTLLGISQVHAQGRPGHPVSVDAGEQVECIIGNHYIPAKLEISKENNAIGNQSPGAGILYTLTVKALDNTAYGVKVTDLLPKGFVYRGGSWTATSNKHGALALSEPTYHSPGTWDVGTIEKDEIITLTLMADVSTDEKPGLYKDLALAYGCQQNSDCAIGGTNSLIASAVDPGQLNTTFVGTAVNIVKDQQDSKTLTVAHEEKTEGSVLGATTDLPSTGANSNWIVLAISLMVTGLGAIVVANKMRRYHA